MNEMSRAISTQSFRFSCLRSERRSVSGPLPAFKEPVTHELELKWGVRQFVVIRLGYVAEPIKHFVNLCGEICGSEVSDRPWEIIPARILNSTDMRIFPIDSVRVVCLRHWLTPQPPNDLALLGVRVSLLL